MGVDGGGDYAWRERAGWGVGRKRKYRSKYKQGRDREREKWEARSQEVCGGFVLLPEVPLGESSQSKFIGSQLMNGRPLEREVAHLPRGLNFFVSTYSLLSHLELGL